MTKVDKLFAHEGTYEDFTEGSDEYFAQQAVDNYGSAVRDNSYSELVAIGKRLENENG